LQIVGQGDGVEDVSVIHAPFSLYPTPFPATEFQRVQTMMPHLSNLVHVVSKDMNYLSNTLKTAAQYDSFTKSLMSVLSRTEEARSRHASPITLGLHRSDYMLDEPSGMLLQVLCTIHDNCFSHFSSDTSAHFGLLYLQCVPRTAYPFSPVRLKLDFIAMFLHNPCHACSHALFSPVHIPAALVNQGCGLQPSANCQSHFLMNASGRTQHHCSVVRIA
jgi:hypothetical protein